MDKVNQAAEILWGAMTCVDRPERADVIYVFGSTDVIVPAFAASLYFRLQPELVVCSGGMAHRNDSLKTGWGESEAVVFAKILQSFGIPMSQILLEVAATNTAENFALSFQNTKHLFNATAERVVIQKPYMTLRTLLTGRKMYPESSFKICAPDLSFADYANFVMQPDRLINIMVGDFQRIIEYGKQGFSERYEFSSDAVAAFELLIHLGYTRHLLK